MLKRISSIILILSIFFGCLTLAEASESPLVILYTNDVHCALDENIGYAGVAAYRDAYRSAGYEVLLADCGDSTHGSSIGLLSQGAAPIEIMNYIGYDVACLGNHEFDSGYYQMLELVELADFPFVSATLFDNQGNHPVNPYVILEAAGIKIAFVGALSPDTKLSVRYDSLRDENGVLLAEFSDGNHGEDLYAAVQTAVDDAVDEGAELVVLLSHLGTDEASSPWTAPELIAHTRGIDVVLDAHSHSIISDAHYPNADGEDVLLSSTGSMLSNVGALLIEEEDGAFTLSTRLHSETLFQDAETQTFVDSIIDKYEEAYHEVIGTSDVDLYMTAHEPNADSALRVVRLRETNLGDLFTDALRIVSGADIGLTSGGSIRSNVAAGQVTLRDVNNIHPFDNTLCIFEITGQELLDALELSVRMLPEENGSFLQISGVTFDVDLSVASPVVVKEDNSMQSINGARRIQNVLVNGEPVNSDSVYTVAASNFIMQGGDGYTLFADNKVLAKDVMPLLEVLVRYIRENLNGHIGEEYADPYGQGRITFLN